MAKTNKVRVKPLRDEKGTQRGVTLETKDGRQAVVVRPETVRHKLSMREQK